MTSPNLSNDDADMVATRIISSVKDRLALSLWWIAIPIYVIAIQYMKTFYLPRSTFKYNIHDLLVRERYAALFLFLILPIILIIINSLSMKQLLQLSNTYNRVMVFKLIWENILFIFMSLVIILIYVF